MSDDLSPYDRLYHAIINNTLVASEWVEVVDVNCRIEVHAMHYGGACYLATPLHYALIKQCSLHTITELCKMGARLDILVEHLSKSTELPFDARVVGLWPISTRQEQHFWHMAQGRSALHMCALSERNRFILRALASTARDIDVCDANGATALQYFLACELFQYVEELVRAGADINRKNDNGLCPLFVAFRLRARNLLPLMLPRASNESIWSCVPLAKHWRTMLRRDDRMDLFEKEAWRSYINDLSTELQRRERKRLCETAIGLAALDLPILCVLGIVAANGDEAYLPPLAWQWKVAKRVKHFNR